MRITSSTSMDFALSTALVAPSPHSKPSRDLQTSFPTETEASRQVTRTQGVLLHACDIVGEYSPAVAAVLLSLIPASVGAELNIPTGRSRQRMLISDFDNTIKPTKDPNERGGVYPGAASLFKALDVTSQGHVHIVTGRPMLSAYALGTTKIPAASISTGDLQGALGYLVGAHGRMQHRKLQNMRSLMNSQPHLPVVLFGDDGERDPQVYHQIMQEYPGRVQAALIHNAVDNPIPNNFLNDPRSIVYRDFAEAARGLAEKGLISDRQARAISREVRGERRPNKRQRLLSDKVNSSH